MAVLKWILGVPILAFIGLAFLGSLLPRKEAAPKPPAAPTLMQTLVQERAGITSQISVGRMKWTMDRFGRVEITGSFVNNSPRRLKDIELKCGFYAESGTKIAEKSATIYQMAFSKQPVDLKKFFIGYVPDQSKSMRCEPFWFSFDD